MRDGDIGLLFKHKAAVPLERPGSCIRLAGATRLRIHSGATQLKHEIPVISPRTQKSRLFLHWNRSLGGICRGWPGSCGGWHRICWVVVR